MGFAGDLNSALTKWFGNLTITNRGRKYAMDNSLLKKASTYDKDGSVKKETEKALGSLKDFRARFPFAENPQLIGNLQPEDIFKTNPDEVGEFFHYINYYLKPFGNLIVPGSSVYFKIRTQLEDFKSLLHVVVDKKKSLAEKIDTPRANVKGLGDDKPIVKEIIFCFNYESGKVLPIFSTSHLKHFVNKFADKPSGAKYYSLGEEYASLTSELLKAKDSLPVTKAWENTYFARFLYDSFPPPDSEKPTVNPSGEGKTINASTNEQLELQAFVKLLGELQTKGKITGQQFRENREQWIQLQPNDRDVLVWRLKQLLKTETKPSLETQKTQPAKPRRL